MESLESFSCHFLEYFFAFLFLRLELKLAVIFFPSCRVFGNIKAKFGIIRTRVSTLRCFLACRRLIPLRFELINLHSEGEKHCTFQTSHVCDREKLSTHRTYQNSQKGITTERSHNKLWQKILMIKIDKWIKITNKKFEHFVPLPYKNVAAKLGPPCKATHPPKYR